MVEHAVSDWLYLEARLSELTQVPELLAIVASASVDRHDVRRWFHLQYVDQLGPSLRVRLDVTEEARADVRIEYADQLLKAGAIEVHERMYAPEHDKFGYGAELDASHDVFCAGTGLAVRHLDPGLSPVAVAAAVQLALTDPLGGRSAAFLYHYAWYWTGRGVLGPGWDESLGTLPPSAADGAVRRAARCILVDHPLGRDLRLLARRMHDVIEHETRRPRTAHFMLHTHLHLLANRLGVLPAQEAYSARVLGLSRAG